MEVSVSSVADPGCFIPDQDPTIFSSRIPDPKMFFIPDPGFYMKNGINYFFLASYAFRSKVLVLVRDHGTEIRDPEKIHPRSQIQGVKK
jgi:hypothetical protein